MIEGRQAYAEGAQLCFCNLDRRGATCRLDPGAALARGSPARGSFSGCGRIAHVVDGRRHERSRAGAPFEISLVQQLLERGEHRQARNPELARERPRRGNALTGTQFPGEDRRAIAVVYLAVQGRAVRLHGDEWNGGLARELLSQVVIRKPWLVVIVS
jgi:hypothetical protein